MAKKKVLLAGESWVSTATHIKGFDQFPTVTYHTGADELLKAMAGRPFDVDLHAGARGAARLPADRRGALRPMTRSSCPTSAPTRCCCIPTPGSIPSRTPNRLKADPRLCARGRRAPDVRRLLQLPGHQWRRALPQDAGRGGAAGHLPAGRRPRRGAGGLRAGRDRPGRPSDPEGRRDRLADPARLQRGGGEGRRRGAGDRVGRVWRAAAARRRHATARAARSPGRRISARTGCRRSSAPGTAMASSGAARSTGRPAAR